MPAAQRGKRKKSQKRKTKDRPAGSEQEARENKQKTIKLSIIILAAAIIIGIAAYLINVNVQLLFDTETHITLSPSITSFTVPDKTPPSVTFTTKVEKLSACEVTCVHILKDETNGVVISRSAGKAEKESGASYSLPITRPGSGQAMFTYTVECTTTNKTLCPSKGKTYTKTSFVTVNHGLSSQETATREILSRDIPIFSEKIARAQTILDKAIATINALNAASDASEEVVEAALLKRSIQVAIEQEETIMNFWASEEYALALDILEENDDWIGQLSDSAKELEQRSSTLKVTYDEAMNATTNIHEQRSMTSGWTGFLARANETTYQDLKNASSAYHELIKGGETPDDLLEKATIITATITRAEQAYVIAKAEQRRMQAIIKETYEPFISALNQTWEGDDCAAYSSTEALLKLENTSTDELEAYIGRYCPELADEQLFTAQPLPELIIKQTEETAPRPLPEPLPQCCHQDECKPCASPGATPIILVHGHSFSKSTSPELAFTSLSKLQEALAKDGYVYASTINSEADLESVPKGDWGKQPSPIVISVTYYYLNYYDLGKLSFTTRKTDSIENYAIRLKENVDAVKEKTGSDKVILIAHSMGGLVAREYIALFGDGDVEKLITLGTPNQGIQGDIRKYCTLTGAKQECSEMAAGSLFLKRLNDPGKEPEQTEVYTVRAEGCPTKTDAGKTAPGDGVVLAESVKLVFAEENYAVNGTCTDLLQKSLHMEFIDPTQYQETYSIIKDILQGR